MLSQSLPQIRGGNKTIGISYTFCEVWNDAPGSRFGVLFLTSDANTFDKIQKSMHGKNIYHFCWQIHVWVNKKQNRESTEGYSNSMVRKIKTSSEKGLVWTSSTYASPKGTGPDVPRSKRPLSACYTRRKCSMETSQNPVKCRVRYNVWSVGGCHFLWSGHRMSFNICERETSILFDKIPVSTIKLPQWWFQAFLDVSLFAKLTCIWKSRRPQDKTSIQGAIPGILYKLRNNDTIGGRGGILLPRNGKFVM